MWRFVNVAFCQCGIFSMCYFANVAFCQCDFLSIWHFVHMAFCQYVNMSIDNMSMGHFVNGILSWVLGAPEIILTQMPC